jgi:hypothetical protein
MSTERKIPCDIYLDESSESGFRFTVIGAVIVPSEDEREISSEIQGAKRHPRAELKWSKLDNRNRATYVRVLDGFVKRHRNEQAFFHCIVLDNQRIDYSVHSYGNVDIGFNKFIYQILMKFAREHGKSHEFYVYPDERRTRQTGDEFRDVLNNGAELKYDIRPYRIVEFRKSHLTPLIQLADVLIGAIAYELNDHHLRTDANAAKIDFMNELKKRFGISTFRKSTPYRQHRFTVWHFDFDRARK